MAYIAREFTALKKLVFHKRASIFQLKLKIALICVSDFNLFLCLKCQEYSKIIIYPNKNTIEGATILKTLPTDV